MTGQQLKNSILQMAVQGRLVPQDPNDEPASVLIERIREEKQRLIKEGKIKKEKNPSYIFRGEDNMPYEKIGNNEPVCIADEVPFDIPESWEWVRLGQCSTYSCSKEKISAKDISPDMWSLDLEDIEKETGKILQYTKASERKITGDKVVFHKDQILYSKLRPYLKKILIAPNDGIATPELVPFDLIGGILPEYMLYVLKCPHIDFVINTVTYGVKMPRVGTETMVSLLIPLPPIKEQLRIVNKINDLMPMVMLYGETQAEIDNYNATFPAILKKSILQFAIQGKLVEQSSSDEPASILLQRIQEEKDALIKAGKIKQDKNESTIYRRDNSYYEKIGHEERCIDDEIPFDIPKSWEWVRVSNIGTMIRGSGIKRTETVKEGYPCVRYGELYTTYNISFDKTVSFIPKEIDVKCKHISKGDILFTLTGENKTDIAKAVVFQGEGSVAVGGDLGYWTSHNMNPYYLVYYMACPYAISCKRKTATGDIIVHISTSKVGNFLLPIPPLSEQNRIVNAIESVFEIINKYSLLTNQ